MQLGLKRASAEGEECADGQRPAKMPRAKGKAKAKAKAKAKMSPKRQAKKPSFAQEGRRGSKGPAAR